MVTSKIAPEPEKDEGFIEDSLDTLDINETSTPAGSSRGGSN